MRHLRVLLFIVIVGTSGLSAQNPIGLYTELTYASRSIWHGWDINADNGSVIHPCVEYSFANTGLSVAAWASLPIERKFKANDDIEFLLKYKNTFLNESLFQFQLNGFADYIICPNATLLRTDGTAQTKMLWKYNLGASFTNLISIANEPLVPAYNLFYFRPFGKIDFKEGSVHEMSLFYTIPVLSKIKIGGTANYHTGVFDGGSGWTHATALMGSSYKVGIFTFAGSINKQWSFNKRPDITDEFWLTFGVSSSF